MAACCGSCTVPRTVPKICAWQTVALITSSTQNRRRNNMLTAAPESFLLISSVYIHGCSRHHVHYLAVIKYLHAEENPPSGEPPHGRPLRGGHACRDFR